MSKREIIMVICPKCKSEHPFTIWPSINTQLDPQMKAAVKDRSAFLFECPSCGEKTYVDYGLLYHQMEDRIWIHYANSEENEREILNATTQNDPLNIMQTLHNDRYLIRIVRSQNELLEKIAIFDEGLDDRLIEIIKLFAFAQFQEDKPDYQFIVILFLADGGKHLLQIIADDHPAGYTEITDDLYDTIRTEFQRILPELREDETLVVDRQWALETFRKIKEG